MHTGFKLVELSGIEPLTSYMPCKRANTCYQDRNAYRFITLLKLQTLDAWEYTYFHVAPFSEVEVTNPLKVEN